MSTITQIAGATVFEGREAVEVYRASALAAACKLYANTKMLVNRAYTPTNMLKVAEQITGKKFKRGEHMKAHTELKAWAAAQIGTTVNK
jgi:hypothetical protein